MAAPEEHSEDARFIELLDAMQRAEREGRAEDAEDAMREMLAYAAEQCQDWSDPQSDFLQLAADCQKRADWEGARKAFQWAIGVADRPANDYYARAKFVTYLLLLDNTAEALEEARRARDAACQEENPVLHWMGLYDHANAALAADALDEARASSDRCLAILEEIAHDGLRMIHQFMRTRALRARVAIAEGDFEAARRALNAGAAPKPDRPHPGVPGIRAAEARWWEAAALLRRHDGDLDGVVEACSHIVDARREILESSWVDEPATRRLYALSLQRLSDALRAAGRAAEAAEPAAECRAILDALGLPPPPDPSQMQDGMIQ